MTTPNVIQIVHATYSAIADVSAITDLLGTYKSLPCVFTSPIVPSGASAPYIHIRGPVGLADIGTKNSGGVAVTQEIVVVSDEQEDDKIYEIADLVIEALNRQQLSLSSDTNLISEVIGISRVISKDDLNGLILTFNQTIIN